MVDIARPTNNGLQFGDRVLVLSNGNFVITDPFEGFLRSVRLYDGKTNQVISTLTGPNGGSARLFEVGDSNFVVFSPGVLGGAITWVNGTTGLNGTISAANSITEAGDLGGLYTEVVKLTNGNYVISNREWNASRGYAHWAPGNGPTVGVISAVE